MPDSGSSRREFLTGSAARNAFSNAGNQIADSLVKRPSPSRGPTLLLRTTAMACDFDVMLNPNEPPAQLDSASSALDLVHDVEQQLTVYRSDSTLSELNRTAYQQPFTADPELFQFLLRAKQISEITSGGFDPTTGSLINLWRRCRQEFRIPNESEVTDALYRSGIDLVQFDAAKHSIGFRREGVEFNLGAIGKGYAVDRAGDFLIKADVKNWLVHGGRSSIKASGTHANLDGWPIGLRSPLLPDKPFATLLLKDAALGTTGTAVQWFRHEGKRYGHILDPKTGWPIESLLSVSVIAPDAALADALSTAFFVLGVEKSLKCCDNLPDSVGAIFFPLPKQGQSLEPILHNVPGDTWFAA